MQMPAGAPGVTPELGLDLLDRPTYPHVYAWVTPPTCIRFTSSAFKPATTTTTTTTSSHAVRHACSQDVTPRRRAPEDDSLKNFRGAEGSG